MTSTEAGEWLAYTVEVTESAAYRFEARVVGTGGRVRLEVNGRPLTAPVDIPATDGALERVSLGEAWLERGETVLRLVIESGGFALNHLQVSNAGSCADIPPDATFSCAEQVLWGKCDEPWMTARCERSCGRCAP